jgi:hypothetical protein
MDFVRQVVNSDVVSQFINLPSSFKGKKLEVIVLPFSEVENKQNKINSLMGVLKNYANPELAEKEKTAWNKALEDKYVNT